MKELSIARRYAKAFFQLALEQKNTKECKVELDRMQAAIAGEPHLLCALADFRIELKARLSVIDELANALKLSQSTQAFLKLCIQKKRIELFPHIHTYFTELFELSEKIATADVLVPHAQVADEIRNRVQALLAEKLGRKAECRVSVDPALLGGFVVQFGDQVFDASYKGRLERMKDTLLAQ